VGDYYRTYLAVAVLGFAAILMFAAMLGVGRLLRPNRVQPEKYITVYALLFVMFDVEAVFIFPWAIRLDRLGTFALVEMAIFIVVLALGLVYAWRKGVLRWA